MTAVQTWVDQLVFRWDADNRSGNTGFGLVAWSCDPEYAEKVFRGVARHLQVAGDGAAPGLVRTGGKTKEDVLLVRRVLGHDPGGRPGTVCHALLGPAGTLDVETSLGLHRWSWDGGGLALNEVGGPLDRVPAGALLRASMPQCDELSRSLPEVAGPLCAATAEVLRNPGSRYTFLDRTGGEFPYRILWGLHGILGELSATHPLGWSFATHDTDDSGNFRFVFVPRWPASASHDERRVRTDLRQPPEDRASSLAIELVKHHLEWSRRGGDGPSRVPAALAAAAGELGRLEPGDALLVAAERAVRHLDSTVLPAGPGRRRRGEADLDVPAFLRSEPATAREPAPAPRRDVRPVSTDEELLHALRGDLSQEGTTRALREVEHRFDGWLPELQGEVGRIALERNLFGNARPAADGRTPVDPGKPGPARTAAERQAPAAPAGRPSAEHGPVTRVVLPRDRRESPRPEHGHRPPTTVIVFAVVIALLLAAIFVRLAVAR